MGRAEGGEWNILHALVRECLEDINKSHLPTSLSNRQSQPEISLEETVLFSVPLIIRLRRQACWGVGSGEGVGQGRCLGVRCLPGVVGSSEPCPESRPPDSVTLSGYLYPAKGDPNVSIEFCLHSHQICFSTNLFSIFEY